MKPRRAKYSNANLWQFTRQSRTLAFDRGRYEKSEEAFDVLPYLRSPWVNVAAQTREEGPVCENKIEQALRQYGLLF